MSIHFVSCFCIDYDMDLLSYWANHYRKYDFDTYHVFLHSWKDPVVDPEQYVREFTKYGFTCEWVKGHFGGGELRHQHIKKYHESLPLTDYIVCADSDEIQNVPDNYRYILSQYDCMMGHLVDCWGDRLVNYDPSRNIDSQYHKRGDLYNLPGYNFVIHPIRTKVLAVKCVLSVDYHGSHLLKGMLPSQVVRTHGDYEVFHYTFRESLLTRMFQRWYYPGWDINNIMRIFNVSPSDPMAKKIEERERERLKRMGWIPASVDDRTDFTERKVLV